MAFCPRMRARRRWRWDRETPSHGPPAPGVPEVKPLTVLVVDDEPLARDTVRELLSAGPAAVASAKELIRSVSHLSLEDAIPVTSKWIADLRATDEAKEGFTAFLEKRKPGWMS